MIFNGNNKGESERNDDQEELSQGRTDSQFFVTLIFSILSKVEQQ